MPKTKRVSDLHMKVLDNMDAEARRIEKDLKEIEKSEHRRKHKGIIHHIRKFFSKK